jgi:hypothetical protein
MKNVILLLYSLVLSSCYLDIAYAEKNDSLSLKYAILSEGETIGVLIHKLFRNESHSRLYGQSQIDISGWWGKINVLGYLVEELDLVNRLVRSESVDLDDSTLYRRAINTNGNHLLVSYGELKEITGSERKQFTSLLQAVSNIDGKQRENLQSLSTALFEKRGEVIEKAQINLSDFDTTENHLPFYLQSLGGKPLPKQLRLLDTEDLTINVVSVTDLGYETMAVGDKTYRCRHLKLTDKKYKPSDIWIDEDSRSLPFMVRFIGEDESGTVEISLKE